MDTPSKPQSRYHNRKTQFILNDGILTAKICRECQIEKPLEDFYANALHKDGRDGKCKECAKKYNNKWRQQNPDKVSAYSQAITPERAEKHNQRLRSKNLDFPDNHWLSQCLRSARERACGRNLPFSVGRVDLLIEISPICPILTIPLIYGCAGGATMHSASIDAFQPNLGYVPGNISIISQLANSMKNCGTSSEYARKLWLWWSNPETTTRENLDFSIGTPSRFWLSERIRQARRRSEQRGIPFALTTVSTLSRPGRPCWSPERATASAASKNYLASICPRLCPVLGVNLVYGNEGHIGPDSATLDRLVPELGYVPGNVYVISQMANQMKNSGRGPEDAKRLYEWWRVGEEKRGITPSGL